MNVDDVIAERIAAARARAELAKKQRAARASARKRGVAIRNAAKLRNHNYRRSRGETMTMLSNLIEALESSPGDHPPFTPSERQIISRYEVALEDCAAPIDIVAEEFATYQAEFGNDSIGYAREHFTSLTTWWHALDALHADLSVDRPSDLAVRLIEHETNRYFWALNTLRRAVCEWLIGTAGPSPVDSGAATFSNFPVVQLNGTAVA